MTPFVVHVRCNVFSYFEALATYWQHFETHCADKTGLTWCRYHRQVFRGIQWFSQHTRMPPNTPRRGANVRLDLLAHLLAALHWHLFTGEKSDFGLLANPHSEGMKFYLKGRIKEKRVLQTCYTRRSTRL